MQHDEVLCSPGANAYFDFLSNSIHLKRLKFEDVWRIQTWYKELSVFEKSNSESHQASTDKADIVHELTHFLDATTTLWGMEYNYRKGRAARAIAAEGKSESFTQAFDVFMVSSAEIDVHHALNQTPGSNSELDSCDLKHFITQHEQYGPLMWVQFRTKGTVVQVVPVSMLSVLEAHAYANETISRFNDAHLILDLRAREKTLNHIKQNYEALMRKQNLTEYTLFLHLANRGMAGIELCTRLRLICAFLRRVLNFDTYEMSIVAVRLAENIENATDGMALVMDMTRGSSRPSVAFKLLSYFCVYVSNLSTAQLTAPCFRIVEKFLRRAINLGPSPAKNLEWETMLQLLSEDFGLADHIVVPQSVKLNRRIATQMSYADGFRRLSSVDPILGDGHALKLAPRIEVGETVDAKGVERSLGLLRRHYQQAHTGKFFMAF